MAFDGVKRTIHRLFGKGVTPTERQRSPLLDEIGPDNMPDGALAAYWEMLDARYPVTNAMIRDSIDLRAGKKRAPMHPNWSMDDRENLRADGPEKYDEPRRLVRRLGSKRARIKRPANGIEPKAQRESTRIEQWDNGYLDEIYDDVAVADLLLNETQTLYVQIPMPCHWEHIPTLYDEYEEEGKHLDKDAYDRLPEKRRREYARATSGESPTYKRMRRRYRLNEKGDADDDSPDFETDLSKSARYFRDEMEDAYARNIPIHPRGPISRLDFIPINPVFSGRGVEVDGVLIRTLYRKAKLKRDYKWTGDDNTELLEPTSSYDGIDGELYLYELWAYDEDHRPYVAYQVGTAATSFRDTDRTAVIRLDEEYPGITELPIAFEYGQHNAGSNADLRVQTYTHSKQQNWLQRDAILTALAISTAESGYPTWAQIMTKDAVEAMRMLGGDVDTAVVMQPNAVIRVFGELKELTSQGSNNDVKVLLQAFGALNDTPEASPGAFGGDGPTSGLDRQVQGKDLEVAHGDVIDAQRRIKEKVGRHALMLGSAIGRKADRPVELYVKTAAVLADGSTGTTRERVSLPPDLCGGNWDVIAEYPHQPGENLAATSMNLTLYKEGVLLLREFREREGDPNPEQFVIEKALEDYYLKNPAGQLDILMGTADYIRDQRLKKLLTLTNQGRMTAQDGGMATVAMSDLLGSNPAAMSSPGGASTGITAPQNPGYAALASGNGAAQRADAAATGSPLMGAPAG